MAEAEVGAIVYRFRADTSGLKAGFAEAQTQMRAMSSGAAEAGQKAAAAGRQMSASFAQAADRVGKVRDEAAKIGNPLKQMRDGVDEVTKGLQRLGGSANDNLRSLGAGAVHAEDGFRRAGGGVDKFNAGLDRVREFAWNNTGFSGDQIDRVINPLQGIAGALGVIPTIAVAAAAATVGALTLIGAKAQGVLAEIGDQARQAGVSADTLRGAEIVGARGGLKSDASREAIANASKEFESFKRNAGEVKESVEKIDEKFLSVLDKTRNFGEFFDAIVQKIRALPQEEGLDLSKALLGEDAGKRLFDQIRAGALDMRALGDAADQAGGSIDEVARRADEMKRKIDEAAEIANQRLLAAFGDLANPVALLELKWQDVKIAIADAAMAAERFIARTRQALDEAKSASQAIIYGPGGLHQTGGEAASSVFARMRQMGVAAETLPPIEVERQQAGVSRARYSARDDKESASSGRSGAAAAERKSAADSYIESLKQSAEMAQAEAENWGKSNTERAKGLALAKAKAAADKEGKTLTEEQTQKVTALAEAEAVAKQRVDDLRRAQQDLNAATREWSGDIVSAFDSLIVQGQKAGQVLSNLARTLASSALKGLLTGEGMFGKAFGLAGSDGAVGGLLGGLFSNFKGLFAEGGNIPAGSWGIAGERGPELITGPASVIPASAMGGPRVTIQNNVAGNVDATTKMTGEQLVVTIDQRVGAAVGSVKDHILEIIEDRQRRS